jgi:lipopolysaccharide/colanic/teichoic acid biosynthesis glycosyltransferase
LKRFFDVLLSSIGLFFLSPFFVVLAIAIKFESKGPVFYRGVRVGRFGKPFRIFKFRSMVANADKSGVMSTNAQDQRITRTGHFIRKFKLDEFSQLLNVLKGDMSLVGPRPEVQKFVDLYTEEQKAILGLRPGITDWSSIKFHNEPEIIAASGIVDADEAYAKLIRPEKLRLQLKYLRERNLLIDCKIIICTIVSIVTTRLGGKYIGIPE